MSEAGDDDSTHRENLEARYQRVCARLAEIDKDLDKPKADERLVFGEAVKAVIAFFDDDPPAFKMGITRSFKRFLAAASDAEQGHQRNLFKPKNLGSRPTRLTEHKLRGIELGVLQQITLVGRSPKKAAELVADRLWKLGVRDDDGNKIAWRSLLNQVRRLNQQPQDTQDAFDAIRQQALALTIEGSEQDTIGALLDMLAVVRTYGS